MSAIKRTSTWPANVDSGPLKSATLILADGREFHGYSFGYEKSVSGEVVFNTGIVGYPESLTDPSYKGQILVLTYPIVGNYGVPNDERDRHGVPMHFEGDRIHVSGLIVADYSFQMSHYTAHQTLADWLVEHKVPAIAGIDTRAVTKHIREEGCMIGKIYIGELPPLTASPVDLVETEVAAPSGTNEKKEEDGGNAAATAVNSSSSSSTTFVRELEVKTWDNPNERNLVAEVSNPVVREYLNEPDKSKRSAYEDHDEEEEGVERNGKKEQKRVTILAVDCGMKYNIIRQFLYHVPYAIRLKIVPWDYPFGDEEFDGLFLSNGPGDPVQCETTIANIRKVMQRRKPIFGICLGNQLLALATGAKTYKMKFGNRGMNQPVIDMRTTRCYITPQNHGFAVDADTLPNEWMQFFVNANDRSNEGIIHRHNPWMSVQFHPEASGGPTDTAFLFYDFLRSVSNPTAISVSLVPLHFPTQNYKVLLLGSGGLSIGQAGEFDYSGTQAIKALKESNVFVVLVNPNIATVQTSSGYADKVYFLPVSPKFVEKVIKKERPDGLLCAFGGQTALNCAVELEKTGVLEKYSCRVLGTPIEAIMETEDRDVFSRSLAEIGVKCAEACSAVSIEECINGARKLGYPVLVRAGFALGGLGSGFAEDEPSLLRICNEAFAHSEQLLLDKSLKGWKEVEYEVMRDAKDNCITVCNMENFDPLGIHTGDSIVVAPSQTLSNEEYFRLREISIKLIRHFGIVGECNVQYAVDPKSKNYCVVEVNARLSRSSALASKATGYPLAYVAAKLALGHDLVQVRNCVTRSTTACFEPSLDYIVTKVPRWDLRKFAKADQKMGSAMKSVGEVMAIGRTFEESIQKALRMVEDNSCGFDGSCFEDIDMIEAELCNPSPKRIWALAKAFEMGYSVEKLGELTKIDNWFLAKLSNINELKKKLKTYNLEDLSAAQMWHIKKYGFGDKQIGVALKTPKLEHEVRIARQALGVKPYVKQIDTLAAEFPAETNYLYLTYQGCEHDVLPLMACFSRSPSQQPSPRGGSPVCCYSSPIHQYHHTTPISGNTRPCSPAGSLAYSTSSTGFKCNYTHNGINSVSNASMASCGSQDLSLSLPINNSVSNIPILPINSVHQPFAAATLGSYPSTEAMMTSSASQSSSAIIVLGCGCYRIGSSVEFDWSAVSCVKTLRSLGQKAIVVNCNPETVSTDYDESDRLYFEDLSLETVLDIWEYEFPSGMIISVGGQTPNNLACGLEENGVRVLGTSVQSIDTCENRNLFSKLCDSLRIDQAAWSVFTSLEAASEFCLRVGFPVLVRPSYVLSGAAMRVVSDQTQMNVFLKEAAVVSREYPVVISKYIENAKEVEMDSVACEGEILNFAISEHVENAGVHSGDATLILPAQKLYVETIRRVRKLSERLAKALNISGPFNIQFMCRQNEVKIIECNLRASRTFPFISKTFNLNFIEQATRVMVGAPVRQANIHLVDLNFVGVKAPMFSFTRLRGADPVLGVEMRSTGEVACFGSDKSEAFLKSLMSTGVKLPNNHILLSTGPLWAKVEFEPYARQLYNMGFTLSCTEGTFQFLKGLWFENNSSYTDKKFEEKKGGDGSDEDGGECIANVQLKIPIGTVGGSSLSTVPVKPGKLKLVYKSFSEKRKKLNAREWIESGKVELVLNVPESMDSTVITNGFMIRRAAIDCGIPLITDIKLAALLVDALYRKYSKETQGKPFWEIRSWDEYILG